MNAEATNPELTAPASPKPRPRRPGTDRSAQRVVRELLSWLWVISGLSSDHRHHGAGPRHSLRLHGKNAAGRRSSAHEPHRLRRQRALHAVPLRLWREPHRQQMIIFRAPIPGPTQDFIKRLIGMPGDTVEIRQRSRLDQRRRLSPSPIATALPARTTTTAR